MSPPSLDTELLSILACPKCRSDLTLASDEKGLICESCRLSYPVRDGIPVMIVEEAKILRPKGFKEVTPVASEDKVALIIVEGKGEGDRIEVEKGSCRALGRSLDEAEKTRLLAIDSSLSLDENSKKIVMRYIGKQFHRGGASLRGGENPESLGSFTRVPDYHLKDESVSRLHAMIFHDESGQVGILDLVSKNGTYVNGAEVESKILRKGDLITIGSTKIRYEQ